jgi:hypothetical protein
MNKFRSNVGVSRIRPLSPNFPKDPNKEKDNGEGWQQPRRGRASSKEKCPRNEKKNPALSKEKGNQPEIVTTKRGRAQDPEHIKKTKMRPLRN